MPPPLSFFFHTIYVKILCIDAFLSSHFHSVLDPRTQGHKLWGDLSRTAGWCFRVNLFRIFLFMYIHFVVFSSLQGDLKTVPWSVCVFLPSVSIVYIYLILLKEKIVHHFDGNTKKIVPVYLSLLLFQTETIIFWQYITLVQKLVPALCRLFQIRGVEPEAAGCASKPTCCIVVSISRILSDPGIPGVRSMDPSLSNSLRPTPCWNKLCK